ncbi:hypothetical protein QL285_075002 [Trifolium repens]|nr:hypothetical protein QL285_075002 [Trifolium repens]
MSARLIVSSPVMTLSPLSPAFNFGIMDHSHSCRVYYEYYPQPLDQSSSFSTRFVPYRWAICRALYTCTLFGFLLHFSQQIIAFAQLAATNCSIWTSVNTRDYNRYAKRLVRNCSTRMKALSLLVIVGIWRKFLQHIFLLVRWTMFTMKFYVVLKLFHAMNISSRVALMTSKYFILVSGQ